MAWTDTGHGLVSENLARAEADARAAGLGIWSQAGAIRPKEWRKRRAAPAAAPDPVAVAPVVPVV